MAFIVGAGETNALTTDSLTGLSIEIMSRVLVIILPLLIISALTSFVLSGMQTRFIFNTKHIAFKMSRLNPLSGLKRLFSPRSLTQVLKSLVLIVIVVAVTWTGIRGFLKNLKSFYFMTVSQSFSLLASSVFNIFIWVCVTIIFIGIVDYFIKWWQYEKDIRMSKQEIKDEIKMSEGDPAVKSAIRSRQQRMAQMRMMQKVPTADVVIVNPQHFAVALKYDAAKNKAPVVIAKGQDNIALKIKEIAAENDIRIEENPPLARALFASVEIDREIPSEFYQAVAEVLSYVYSLKRKQSYLA